MSDITYSRFHGATPWADEPVETTNLPAAFFDHVEAALEAVYAQANIGAAAAGSGMYGVNNLSEVVSKRKARANIEAMHAISPMAYGAVGDGVHDDSAAIMAADAALAAGGGGFLDLRGTYFASATQLKISAGNAWGSNANCKGSGAALLKVDSTRTGFCIETDLNAKGPSVIGLDLTTDAVAALTHALGGIHFNTSLYPTVLHTTVGGVSDNAIQCVGVGGLIEDVGLITFTSGRTLTDYCGALHIQGTDHCVGYEVQCNGGNDNTTVAYPGNFYRCGVYIKALASMFGFCNGEFADAGIVFGATASGNLMLGLRGDYNAGHGILVKAGANMNVFALTPVINNSQAAHATYDGVYLESGSIGNKFGKIVGGGVTATLMRYLYNDQNALYAGKFANTVDEVFTAIPGACYAVDAVNQAAGFLPTMQPQGSGARQTRERSRWLYGRTYDDQTAGTTVIAGKNGWRRVKDDKPDGNMLIPQISESRSDTLTSAWSASLADKGAVAIKYVAQQTSTIATQLGLIASPQVTQCTELTADAGAVTAGYMAVNTGIGTRLLPVDLTRDITAGCRAILAAGVAATVTCQVIFTFFNSSFGTTGTATGTATALNTATKVDTIFSVASGSIPALTAWCVVQFKFSRSGAITSGDKVYIGPAMVAQDTVSVLVPT